MPSQRQPLGTGLLAALALSVSWLAAPAALGTQDTDPDLARALQRADALYGQQSYARALRHYEEAQARIRAGAAVRPEEARWVELRLADARWRDKAASQTHDQTVFEQSRQALEALIRALDEKGERQGVWAEAHESLGDFWWDRSGGQNWGQGWSHYQKALDFWSGHRDLDLARRRYLDIVWRMAEPHWRRNHWWGWHHSVPLEVLENARTIARRPDDRARAHYLVAITLRHNWNWAQRRRVEREFEAALKFGPNNPWYDDALYHYAEWLGSSGRVTLRADGQWGQEQDYVEALKLYRRLVREFDKGETRYWDNARNQIRQITAPALGASVSNIFLPGSEIQFNLSWRNLAAIDLAIYRVDLTRDLDPTRAATHLHGWVQHVDVSAASKVKGWTFDTKDTSEHKTGQEQARLDDRLAPGAYLLEASGGGKSARELILVTDVSVVLKTWSGQVAAFVCDAVSGAPIAGARVRIWDYRYTNDRWTGSDEIGRTDRDGLARFKVRTGSRSRESAYGVLVATSVDGRQAFALGSAVAARSRDLSWKIYATTDRPAYRPKETVRWKMTARTNDGTGYSVPADEVVNYQIQGPRGKVDEGTLTLNAFGSAWTELELDESMALGEYSVTFRDGKRTVGSAGLFRLEEYKLPEFEVSVTTPSGPGGARKAFLVGEPVEVLVEAGYYFGGPVANANVELIVYQKPFHHWWMPPRDYPWFYESPQRWNHRGWGPGQEIKRQTIRTDQAGRASAVFETPAGGGQDYEYTIEARVTDSSRREIVGHATVRVTRQHYYVYPHPRKSLYRPGETVEIDLTTIDANRAPVSVEGTVKVTRERWVEVWLDPAGREVTGSALEGARRRAEVFPPPPRRPGDAGWRLKFRGYSSQEVLTRTVKTDAEGKATLAFIGQDEGYYRIAWRSDDPGAGPITAQANVWVATHASTELGYRSGGVEIVVDKDTFRVGETAAVMLSVPTNDRYVLLSIEGEDMHRFELVHVTGTVKLVQIPIEKRHIPNVFIQAVMVSDGRIFADQEQVIVPPAEQFLEVEVTADRQVYEPRDGGTLTVTTRDADGKPVSAEVSLALVDESVFSIQADYAGDPREFFFNDRQQLMVRTGSTFNHKAYIKLVEAANEQLVDLKTELTRSEHAGNRSNGRQRSAEMQEAYFKSGSFDDSTLALADAEGVAMGLESRRAPGPLAVMQQPAVLGQGGAGGQEPAVVVRSDFRSTILWQPDLETGADGRATVRVQYADSLTRWKATARAVTPSTQVGIGTATTRTRKPLIARLQAPRFFTAGDTVTVSGVFNNNTDEPIDVRCDLVAEGLKIAAVLEGGRPSHGGPGEVRVPPGGEARVDWLIAAERPGAALLRLTGRGGGHADAMEKTFRIHEHGIDKFIARSGKVRGEAVTVTLGLPARREGSTTMTVSVTSSMAVTMLDALPYLVDYPYGCTEQTMSRFLPAVVTARTLQDLGLSAEDALGRVFGGIEAAAAEKLHQPAKRANLRKLDQIVGAGLDRLYDFQHGDGGWGWWKKGQSDHFMTAYVLWGLCLARQADRDVRLDVMERAAGFLALELVEAEARPDLQAWMLHALAAWHVARGSDALGKHEQRAVANLWSARGRLNAYARALLALAFHAYGDQEKARLLVRNLENGVKRDDAPDTSILLGRGRKSHPAVIGQAHWGADGIWWRWSEGPIEATSFALRALLAIEPDHELVEPVVNWLIKNRRGAQWTNSRDSAVAILALNDYLRASGELEPDFEYELVVNGASIAREKVTAAQALRAPSRYRIDPRHIRDGANTIEIVRLNGEGPIYFAAEASFFSLEEPIAPAGNEIFVRRDYYRLVPRETLLKGFVYDRLPLRDGDYVTSGERVEVIVTVETKNDYEYLVFEDTKPAGLEAVQIRSGESMFASQLTSGATVERFGSPDVQPGSPPEAGVREPGRRDGKGLTGRRRWVHQELRDRKVALFCDKLPEGVWEMRYDLRAEVPGLFHALPVLGHAMYVPEIRCNSSEVRLTVNDRPADVAQADE